MKKARQALVMMVLAALVSTAVGVSSVARAQDEYWTPPMPTPPYVSVSQTHIGYLERFPDAFTEKGSALGARLFEFRISYIGFPSHRKITPEEEATVRTAFGRAVFVFTELGGITPRDAGEMRLVRDVNKNSVVDEGDRVVARSALSFDDGKIAFVFEENPDFIGHIEQAHYLLVGDFPTLRDGAHMRLVLDRRLLGFKAWEGGKEREPLSPTDGFSFYAEKPAWHREGNAIPILEYNDMSGYTGVDIKKGVSPTEGDPGTVFTFSLKYRDEDGEEPKRVEVWIDLNTDDVFAPEERFPLALKYSFGIPWDAMFYTGKVRVFPANVGVVRYRFFATDGKNEAVGPPTGVIPFPVRRSLFVQPPRFDKKTALPGEHIGVRYRVVYLYETVTIDWGSVEENDFSPFLFLGAVNKNRRSSGLFHDAEELYLELLVPPSYDKKTITLPSLSLRFTAWKLVEPTNEEKKQEDAGGEQREKTEKGIEIPLSALSPQRTLAIVPLKAVYRVITPNVPLTIGAPFVVELHLARREEVVVRDTFPRDLSFAPFYQQGAFRKKSEFTDNGVVYSVYSATLAPFFLPGGVTAKKGGFLPSFPLEYRRLGEQDFSLFKIAPLPVPVYRLSTADILKTPFPFARKEDASLSRSWLTPLHEENAAVWYATYSIGAVLLILVLFHPVRLLSSAVFGGRSYRMWMARLRWATIMRVSLSSLARTPASRMTALHALEHVFRENVAFRLRLPATMGQSVLLHDAVFRARVLSEDQRKAILRCLELFYLVERRESGDGYFPELIALQRQLFATLRR